MRTPYPPIATFAFLIAMLAVLSCVIDASAGVPDLSRSGCALSPQPLACQWRFRYGHAWPTGPMDVLTLKLTLRNQYDMPVANCSTYCTMAGASIVATSCDGERRGGLSNSVGILSFIYPCIGGRGRVDLRVTAVTSVGHLPVCSKTIQFTSTDLDASRDTDNGATNVIDLGMFAACLPPSYCVTSDFDCNGTINVIDFGLFATGIGRTCSNCSGD